MPITHMLQKSKFILKSEFARVSSRVCEAFIPPGIYKLMLMLLFSKSTPDSSSNLQVD
jgi:hypothetical protein